MSMHHSSLLHVPLPSTSLPPTLPRNFTAAYKQAALSPSVVTYLLSVAVDEQVKGNSSHHVDEEPAFEIVDGYAHRVAHHFVVRVHVCCPERNREDQTLIVVVAVSSFTTSSVQNNDCDYRLFCDCCCNEERRYSSDLKLMRMSIMNMMSTMRSTTLRGEQE